MIDSILFAFQVVGFVLQWLVGVITDNPLLPVYVVLFMVICFLIWKLLNYLAIPKFLSTSKGALVLQIVLLLVALRSYSTNEKLLEVQHDLENAQWRLKQGAQHSINLLQKLEKMNMVKVNSPDEESGDDEESYADNPLHGCLNVILDFGSNSPELLKHVYQPDTCPAGQVQSILRNSFGELNKKLLKRTCMVIFEQDSARLSEKKKMSKSYERCDFLIEVNPKEIQDSVESLADFINNKLAKRAIPSSDEEGKAVLVLGSKNDGLNKILPNLLVSGALGHLDTIIVDSTDTSEAETINSMIALGELTASEGMEHQFEVIKLQEEIGKCSAEKSKTC